MSKLLVVDDEQAICWGLQRLGQQLGHEVTTASSAEQAVELAAQDKPDVVILDVRLPGMDGLSAIGQLRQHIGPAPIIVITAYGDLQTAVQAVRNGAFEYIVKPFDSATVRQTLLRALQEPEAGSQAAPAVPVVEGFVGSTPAMQEAYNRIALAAASDACVLLHGESGTGKELAARAIHKYSRRSERPFVAVNVAALSPSLAESELFGHVRGAFTGADQPRRGLLVEADGGTLFLDEVAEIPLPLQAKLLRALEQREVTPVGTGAAAPADFRVISATHRDLPALIAEGRFRHDLFFRIHAFQIDLPPLRQRRPDIVPLANHFIRLLSGEQETGQRLSAEAADELMRRDWTGNVRELRNAIEHALIVSRGGVLLPHHLPQSAPVREPGLGRDLEAQIADLLRQWTRQRLEHEGEEALYESLLALVEPPMLECVLQSRSGQVAAAARVLGLHRTTLRKKLDQRGRQ